MTNARNLSSFGRNSPVVPSGTLVEDIFTLSITDLGVGLALRGDTGSIQVVDIDVGGGSSVSDSLDPGQGVTLMLSVGAGTTITWPTTTWVNNGGIAPTLATTGYTVIAFWKVGTTLYGALVGDGS